VRPKVSFHWKTIIFPFLIIDYIKYRKTLFVTRKNILFTRQLAFEAAEEIWKGMDRNSAIEMIDTKTKRILFKEGKGLYTEKVRRKQIGEIKRLIDHYLRLMDAKGSVYSDVLIEAYESKKNYMLFIGRVRQAEQDVIHASISSVRKGSKKDRLNWFHRVKKITDEVRTREMEEVFSD
jgi:hypothetical protein